MTAPEEEDESSKTEEASEHKKQKAKEEGNVALSQDAKSFIMLLGMLFVVWLLFPIMGKWYLTDFSYLITDVDSVPTDEKHLRFLFKNITISFFKIMAVPFLLLMILGIFASIGQTGFIFAPKKLEPNWDKLNIFTGLKKFITMQKIFDSLKGIVKITVIGFIGLLVIRPYLPDANLMPDMSIGGILGLTHKIIVLLIFTVVCATLIIALADFAYQKYSHLKKLRMTKQEVKDEYKQTEGDPLVKSKIRQVRMERARHRMMDNVHKADVVIVNPTHFAVALEYKMETMEVPVVVAKGVDYMAQKIKEIAREDEIPIVENPPLARALYASVDIDEPIPTEHFKAVAEVIGYVMQLKNPQT
ncbi:MAG: flagellar biosynthesis protein FlhB [Alphaproteobacteria bacterium]|nr:flagellar biosynthesis protein FlhB [Alphaproteobacteria bacterium]